MPVVSVPVLLDALPVLLGGLPVLLPSIAPCPGVDALLDGCTDWNVATLQKPKSVDPSATVPFATHRAGQMTNTQQHPILTFALPSSFEP